MFGNNWRLKLARAAYRALLLRDIDSSAEAAYARSGADDAPEEILKTLLASREFRSQIERFVKHYTGVTAVVEHSQNGEFLKLLQMLMGGDDARRQIVVDVGARGRDRSNSFDLMRLFAWHGVLIEANPALIPIIEADFAGLSFNLVNCAVSDTEGEATLYIGINDDVSSLDRQSALNWGELRGERSIPVRRLGSILAEQNVGLDFSLLSLDIEGFDVRVLNDLIGTSEYRPRLVVIEVGDAARGRSMDQIGFSEVIHSEYVFADAVGPNLILQHRP